jgi:hypothetical protein
MSEREELAKYVDRAAKEAGDVGALITQTKLEMAAALLRQPPAPVQVSEEMVGRALEAYRDAYCRDDLEHEPAMKRALEAALQAGVPSGIDNRIAPIFAELERATKKFPTWPTDPLHAFAVVGEEFGECQKEVLQLVYEPHKSSPEEVRKEAIQMAAMALRFVMSLDVYIYTAREQHSQQQIAAAPAPGENTIAPCKACGDTVGICRRLERTDCPRKAVAQAPGEGR